MVKQNLVIVESPTKAKTIERYLGKNFKVVASKGHLRDLPKSKMGVDIENNYIWSVYIFLISLTTIFFNVINSIISNSKGIEVHNYRKMENLCEYLLQKLK